MSQELNKSIYKFGVAYYPDYVQSQSWMLDQKRAFRGTLKERMAYDFEKMKRCRVEEIRIGEFSWSTIEPSLKKFETATIDLCLEFSEKYSIEVILCTPTSTPPKWLFDLYPDILPLRADGSQVHWGSRRHYDPLHPGFKEHADRISEFYAKTWGLHPQVVGWQIDNEWGHHGSSSLYTSRAKSAFIDFLDAKYGSIESLNLNWFACFWSQGLRSFDEVELPLATWADMNPHLQVDFREFCTATFRKFQKSQIDIIKKHSPNRYVTHNLISNFYELCPWEMTQDLDLVGFDHYQDDPLPNPTRSLVNFSLMSGLAQSKASGLKFKILEQQPVQVNWQPINRRFQIDWLLLWASQSSMLGANSMDYFSFQKFYGGAEQYHDGLLSHDLRNPESSQERVMASSHAMFSKLKDTFSFNTLPQLDATVLIVHNTKSLWSHRICAQSTYYDSVYQLDDLAILFSQSGIGFRYVESIPDTLTPSDRLILPGYAFELTSEEQHRLRSFLERGGQIWTLPRTSMKQGNNHMSPLPLSILDSEGLYMADYGALGPEERETITLEEFDSSGSSATAKKKSTLVGYRWAEKIKLTSDLFKPLGYFKDGIYKDSPAILERRLGKGRHIHFAFCPLITEDFLRWVSESGILKVELKSPCPDVHIYPLVQGSKKFYGIMNFSDHLQMVSHSDLKITKGISFSLTHELDLSEPPIDLSTPKFFKVDRRSATWIQMES